MVGVGYYSTADAASVSDTPKDMCNQNEEMVTADEDWENYAYAYTLYIRETDSWGSVSAREYRSGRFLIQAKGNDLTRKGRILINGKWERFGYNLDYKTKGTYKYDSSCYDENGNWVHLLIKDIDFL